MGIINAQLNVITAKSRFQPGSYVWFGQPNQIPDPDNPATLKIPYLDADLTQPASAIQGLDSDSKFQQTITGFLYGSGLYSIRVMTAADNTGTQLYYIPEVAVTATINELGTAAYADIATEAQALAGTPGVLPDAAGVHAAFKQFGLGGSPVEQSYEDIAAFTASRISTAFDSAVVPGTRAVLSLRGIGGLGADLAARGTTSDPEIHFRSVDVGSGTVSSFVELYHTGNILGTVSQSGGVPTGAIIEHGANANGRYVKYADGTMICRIKFGVSAVNTATFTLQGINYYRIRDDWTFPSAFIDITNLSISALAEQNSDNLLVTTKTRSVTTAGVSIDSVSATSFSSFARTSLSCVAIGRWY